MTHDNGAYVNLEQFADAVNAVARVATADQASGVDSISMALACIEAVGLYVPGSVMDQYLGRVNAR